MISFLDFVKTRSKSNLKEDKLLDCDGAAMGGGEVSAPSSDSSTDSSVISPDKGMTSTEVLGDYKPGEGVFGPGDFHIPDMLFRYDRFGGATAYYKKNKKNKKKKKHLKYDNLTETDDIPRTIQGLENHNIDDISELIWNYLTEYINDNDLEIELIGLYIHGSRLRGDAKRSSDLDVVVEYEGDFKEDALFDILHEEPFKIYNILVDFNPIRKQETGTLADYIEQSKEYDKEKLSRH